jgi:hypothetical protein
VDRKRERQRLQKLCYLYRALWYNYAMLTNKMHFIIFFDSVLLVFYMFRTSYVLHHEDYILHAVLNGMFSMRYIIIIIIITNSN